MKKQTKTLTLRVETLRNLGVPELANVFGGCDDAALAVTKRKKSQTCAEVQLFVSATQSAGGRCEDEFMRISCDISYKAGPKLK